MIDEHALTPVMAERRLLDLSNQMTHSEPSWSLDPDGRPYEYMLSDGDGDLG